MSTRDAMTELGKAMMNARRAIDALGVDNSPRGVLIPAADLEVDLQQMGRSLQRLREALLAEEEA